MVHGRRLLSLGVRAVQLSTRQCSGAQSSGGGFKFPSVAATQRWSSQSLLPPNVSMVASRSMSCCAKLDLPPPTEVTVEYHENSDNTDYFIKLADGIGRCYSNDDGICILNYDREDAHPDIMVTGNPEGMTPRDGAFEVSAGEYILFSKLKEHRLPTLEDILRAIDERSTQTLSCELEGVEKVAHA